MQIGCHFHTYIYIFFYFHFVVFNINYLILIDRKRYYIIDIIKSEIDYRKNKHRRKKQLSTIDKLGMN